MGVWGERVQADGRRAGRQGHIGVGATASGPPVTQPLVLVHDIEVRHAGRLSRMHTAQVQYPSFRPPSMQCVPV